MPSFVLLALLAGIVGVHLFAKYRVSAAVLILSTFIIPSALKVPNTPADVLVLRVGLAAAVLGILMRVRNGEIHGSAMRASRVFLALAAFIVAAYIFGVAGAPFPSSPRAGLSAWLTLLDQLVFLWAATVAVRTLGARWVAGCAAIGVLIAAGIGIAEHWTETSYARCWWFKGQLSDRLPPASELHLRGTKLRSRATADFALQYGWVLMYFLPIVFVMAKRRRAWLGLIAPVVLVLALYFSITRSAYAGLAAGGVMLVFFARGDRRVLMPLFAGAVVASFLYLGTSAVREPYSAAEPDSLDSRARRLERVTEELATRPYTGVGLDGLEKRGVLSTDTAYLQLYAATGAIGVALLGGALAAAACAACAAALYNEHEDALLAAAVLGGVISGGIAAFSFDSLSGAFASWNLWLLGALAVGLTERSAIQRAITDGVARRKWSPSPWRLAVPVGGLLIGVIVWSAAPTHTSVRFKMLTLVPVFLERNTETPNDGYLGRLIINSTCQNARARLGESARLDCRGDPFLQGPGTGTVRIETDTRAEALAARATFEQVALNVHQNTEFRTVSGPEKGKPTFARTAPVSGVIAGTELALLAPPMVFRRRARKNDADQ